MLQLRMSKEGMQYWRDVAAVLMLDGVLKTSTLSALMRYGLRLVHEKHSEQLSALRGNENAGL